MHTETRHLSVFGSVPHFLLKQIHLSEFLHFALPVLWLASLPPLTRLLQSSCRKRSRVRYGAASQWLKHALITPLPPLSRTGTSLTRRQFMLAVNFWEKKKKQKQKNRALFCECSLASIIRKYCGKRL